MDELSTKNIKESVNLKFFDKLMDLSVILITIFSGILTLSQCFDNNFWGDEAYTILMVNSAKNLKEVAMCDLSNPPIMFLALKMVTVLFGQNYFAYHLASAIPSLILLLFSVCCVKKEFGRTTSFIFTLFLTITVTARTYAVEVRMYAWASMLFVLCFYEGYKLLKTKGKVVLHWVLFCIFGLGASYTHYFTFASTILLYCFVFLGLILQDRKNFRYCLGCAVVSLVAYLPWLSIFFTAVADASAAKSWIQNIYPIKDGFCYIFQNPLVVVIFGIFLITSFVYSYGSVAMIKERNFSIKKVFFNFAKNEDSIMWMVLSVCFTAFFLLVFEVIYGLFKQPIFVDRYIYPVAVAMWLAFAMLVGNVKNYAIKRYTAIGVVFALCMLYANDFVDVMTKYYERNQQTQAVVDMIEEAKLEGNVYLYTDVNHYLWTVFDYYFPEIPYESVNLEQGYKISDTAANTVFLFMSEKMEDVKLDYYGEVTGMDLEFLYETLFAEARTYLYKAKMK